jgi:hypothetical protein
VILIRAPPVVRRQQPSRLPMALPLGGKRLDNNHCNLCSWNIKGEVVFCECKLFGFCTLSCKKKYSSSHQNYEMCADSKKFVIGLEGCPDCKSGDVEFSFLTKKDTLYTASVVTVGRVSTARLLGMCGNHG